MPSPNVQHLRLSNGLHVTLLHAPWLNRCGAALRIDAGSHDEPPEYPDWRISSNTWCFLAAATSLRRTACCP